MAIDPSEAASSLKDIAAVEQRTHEAIFYAGSSTIFIMWGLLVACGYGFAELYPHVAMMSWLAITLLGCLGTFLIVSARADTREAHDLRLIWAMAAMAAYGAVWSFVLHAHIPRALMYAFQPSLFLLGIVLAGFWLGRFFIVLGCAGLALVVIGFLQGEPWLRLWMAVSQSGTLILGGVWLHRHGVAR
jgi:hypothetical protein